MKNKNLIALVFMMSLTACGEGNQSDQNNKPKTHIEDALSTQLDALEKSKQVEQKLLDATEKRDKLIEDQGI